MKVKGRFVLRAVCGLFKGAYYNNQMSEVCVVYLRLCTKQGRGSIEEIRYLSIVCKIYEHEDNRDIHYSTVCAGEE